MIKRALLPLILLGSLFAAAPANAAFTLGIGDQSPNLFQRELWQDLRLKKVRYLVPWNSAVNDPRQLAEVDQYMAAARGARQDVLVHFTALRPCYRDGKYSKSKACKAPTVREYTKAFKAFKARFPYVKTYGAWNEANHVSQPVYSKRGTGRGPKLAAQYFLALRKNCKGCKIVAGDLLDSGNMRTYARSMMKTTGSKARLWGLHNYADVNRNRAKGVQTLLKTVPGEVWMTETGGIVKFDSPSLKTSEKTAVRAINYMFALARKYDSKLRGYRSRIGRLYQYDFGPTAADARFDASLLAPDGEPRKAYDAFKKQARRSKK